MIKKYTVLHVAVVLLQTSAAFAEIRFSLDSASPSLTGNITPDDVLTARPLTIVEADIDGFEPSDINAISTVRIRSLRPAIRRIRVCSRFL